jgi:hypothetical protein
MGATGAVDVADAEAARAAAEAGAVCAAAGKHISKPRNPAKKPVVAGNRLAAKWAKTFTKTVFLRATA